MGAGRKKYVSHRKTANGCRLFERTSQPKTELWVNGAMTGLNAGKRGKANSALTETVLLPRQLLVLAEDVPRHPPGGVVRQADERRRDLPEVIAHRGPSLWWGRFRTKNQKKSSQQKKMQREIELHSPGYAVSFVNAHGGQEQAKEKRILSWSPPSQEAVLGALSERGKIIALQDMFLAVLAKIAQKPTALAVRCVHCWRGKVLAGGMSRIPTQSGFI